MKISVFGLGYVGCVSSACLSKEGHDVIGVDVNQTKVDIINEGKSPIVEKDLEDIIKDSVACDRGNGRLRATIDSLEAIQNSDISLICVGTPSNFNGSLRLDIVKKCASDIGEVIRNKGDYHIVVARSTMLPGTVEEVIIPILEEKSGKNVGADFGIVMNPEFLRESTSVFDFYNPPMTVIGAYDDRSGDEIEKMYHFLKTPFVRINIKTAEMMKYANNVFHGIKVSFANEIGNICKAIGVDSHEVMNIFCMDNKLNISPYYLKPGFAFGGSCLPKDLKAINYKAKVLDIEMPLISSVLNSNKQQIENVINRVVRSGKKNVAVLGLSFKAGTDDLRESPLVILVETLIGKGFNMKIYDKDVSIAKLFGANKEYIEKEIPHISSLMVPTIDDALNHGELIIIGNKSKEFKSALAMCKDDQLIYDLVRITDDLDNVPEGYEGICW
jgi:GDP-mannose 6-dehydrogenase